MPHIDRELNEVWDALRASKGQRDEALVEVRITNLRGIEDLRFPFDYPVSVLAGPNGSGKSTVLFACACAYRVPGRGPRGTSLPADCSPISSVSSHPCGRTRRPRRNSSSTICIGAIVVPWSGGGEDRGLGAETASPNDRSICAPSQISPVRPRCGAYCSLEQSRSGWRRSVRTC